MSPQANSIWIKDMTFKHDIIDSPKMQLDQLSLQLKRGKPTAIVGASGCGKTTLMSVMRGLYPCNKGYVQCEEIEISVENFSENVFLFPQIPEIFSDTILYNITMGYSSTTEEIEHIMDVSQFTEVIKRLPRGLETNIAEKGVNLSGGERQRLALCRSIFFAVRQKSQVLLLDEITSSVDGLNEAEIFSKLLKLFSKHFILASIHKLNLLAHFDFIYVIQEGKVVQEGEYNNLKQSGHFLEMVQAFQKQELERTPG